MKGLKGGKTMQAIKKLLTGLSVALLLTVVTFGGNAQAQTVSPVFNWHTNVSGVGDEHDFLRIGQNAAEGVNTKEICQDGAEVVFWFYIHNSAEEQFNGNNFDGPGVAHNAKVKVNVPQNQLGNSHAISAAISADNAATVTDNATITCGSKKIKLEYAGVTAFNPVTPTNALGNYTLGGDPINGASLGYPGGTVPGCWDFRSRINFKVIVHVEADKPVEKPVEKPKPKELPNTGAGSVLALVGGTSVAAGLAHYFIQRRKYNV